MEKEIELARFPIDLDVVHIELLQTYFECQVRGLVHSCKWLSDLLTSFATHSKPVDFSAIDIYQNILPVNFSTFLLAKSVFDNREYDHCAQILEQIFYPKSQKIGTNDMTSCDPLLYFLYIYARYMACEKRRANDEVELRRVLDQDGSAKSSRIAISRCNKELLSLQRQIETYTHELKHNPSQHRCTGFNQAFILYVHALICRKLEMKDTAISLLVDSIKCKSSMWPAWFELTTLIEDKEMMTNLNLPSMSESWMRYFFESKIFLRLHEGERALEILLRLGKSGFENSQNLQAEIGLAHDVSRSMELAKKQFKQLFTNAPCRLDNVDTYSNVLFVCEDSAELAYLAHHCVNLDKYRPETCCVIGNFFSLRGQHEKAVIYFQRALKLKPTYSLVWTLIGHEYMELRNTYAAVLAYRQALVHNHHDFRAWYGLGQMYEMLDLPSFALYYYREAQYLMPTDSRLIVALGEIYEKLNRLDEAKKCYWRAYCVGDIEGGALVRLALCFKQSCESAEVAAAYTEFIKLCQRNGVHNQNDLAKAYKYLANYHLDEGHYEDAALAANKCLEFPETREEAKAMFRQITMLAGQIELLSVNNDEESTSGCSGENVQNSNLNQDSNNNNNNNTNNDNNNQIKTKLNLPKSQSVEIQPLDLSLDHLLIALGETKSDQSLTTQSSLAHLYHPGDNTNIKQAHPVYIPSPVMINQDLSREFVIPTPPLGGQMNSSSRLLTQPQSSSGTELWPNQIGYASHNCQTPIINVPVPQSLSRPGSVVMDLNFNRSSIDGNESVSLDEGGETSDYHQHQSSHE